MGGGGDPDGGGGGGKGGGGGGGKARRYLGGDQAEARGRNGVWIRSGAGCLKERAGGCVVAAGSLSRPVLVLDIGAGKGKGTKNAGTRTRKAQKAGAFFRGTAGGRLGDEKTGARGRSAREAH